MKKHILFIAGLFSCAMLNAQNWTGAVNSDWNNPVNWSAAPSNGDDILIDPANYAGAMAQPVISSNSNFTPAEMLVQNGAKLTISANLSASDRVEILGEGTVVTITAGTYAVNGGGNNARLIFAEGGELLMNGGTLIAGQRLLFELGGKGEINAGTVTVGETIAIVDGSATEPSHLVLNGGTVTTNAEFGFENEAGEFYPWFEQNGGTLNVNGDMLWLGADPGSGRGTFIINEGITKVSGTITNDPASTMSVTIKLSGENALLELSGTNVSLLAGDSVIINNSATWKDVNTVTWVNNGAVFSDSDGLYQSGFSTLTGNGSYQFANVHVPVSRLLNHVTPAVVSISGNTNVEGTFINNTNKLILNGNSEQLMTASGAGFSFYDLEINNSLPDDYGIQFNSSVFVAHELSVTNGLVNILPSETMHLSASSIVIGGSETAFIDGYLEKTGASALTFPLGIAPDVYRPLTISAPASSGTIVRTAYKGSAYTTLAPAEAPLQAVSSLEYWDLSRTGSSDLFTVSMGWNNAAASGLVNCDDITATVWNGSEWKFVASGTTGLCSGQNAGSVFTTVELPATGPLTIGFTSNVFQQAVTICPGETFTVGESVYSTSGTYTDLLEAQNGDDSTVITVLTVLEPLEITLQSSITSITATAEGAIAFQWINCNDNTLISGAESATFTPLNNGSYAVIAYQENCDNGDTSECVVIDQLLLKENAGLNVVLYPNPLTAGGEFTIQSDAGIYAVRIYGAEGKMVVDKPFTGENLLKINPENVKPGIYIVELLSEKEKAVTRLIID